PRTLVTYVRYPALGAPTATDVADAPPASAAGPFPLVVFAHGFAVTPAIYSNLLQSWARAGYVVAAPVPRAATEHAPGAPAASAARGAGNGGHVERTEVHVQVLRGRAATEVSAAAAPGEAPASLHARAAAAGNSRARDARVPRRLPRGARRGAHEPHGARRRP